MDVSQLYMLALRPTMVPIAGESWHEGGIAGVIPTFKGLVELESWSWDFHNQEERKKREDAADDYREAGTELENRRNAEINREFDTEMARLENKISGRNLQRQIADLKTEIRSAVNDASDSDSQAERTRRLADLEKSARELGTELNSSFKDIQKQYRAATNTRTDAERAEQERERRNKDRRQDIEDRKAEALRNKNFEFTFTKRVDVATTQLLNCMKAGDLLPKVTMIMHQSSSNTPWTLVITVSKMRLLKYQLRIEVSDTMTDMREEWTCEFASFGYVYQNRPHAGAKSLTAGGAAQTAAKVATQGTVRAFMMNNMDFF